MNKSCASNNNIPRVECINYKINKYRIRWDFKTLYNEKGDEIGVTFMEDEIAHKPTLDEIKSIVINGINKQIDDEILTGFKWKDMGIWLSLENQWNYKAVYDLSVQTNGNNLPVIFKFENNNEPIYYQFDTLEEISDFYFKMMNFINTTLLTGWRKKDSINWELYQV